MKVKNITTTILLDDGTEYFADSMNFDMHFEKLGGIERMIERKVKEAQVDLLFVNN